MAAIFIRSPTPTLSYTNLTNANLSTLPDRSVASCKFNGATLTGAILTGVQNLNKATWTSAVLAHTDLSHVDPSGVAGIDFSTLESEPRLDLTGATLSNGKPLAANFKYGAANFNHANLSQAVLDHIDFVGAHFRKAILAGANLTGADLSNADLTGADLTGAILADTILTGATLDETMFDHCDLSTTKFGPAPKFGTSGSTRTSFRSATVPASTLGSNWSYLDLTDATITHIPNEHRQPECRSGTAPRPGEPAEGRPLRRLRRFVPGYAHVWRPASGCQSARGKDDEGAAQECQARRRQPHDGGHDRCLADRRNRHTNNAEKRPRSGLPDRRFHVQHRARSGAL